MRLVDTSLAGVKILEPQIYRDSRGFFMESYNQQTFSELVGESVVFVQDNHSRSSKGVLRGLHYQAAPKAQGKLVRVALGEVLDVVVDIRPQSPTFGRWLGVVLSAENQRQLWVPPGFAHGFYVRSPVVEYLYKTTDYYSSAHEGSIAWDDQTLGIDWQLESEPIISEKDRAAAAFNAANYL